MIDHDPDRSDPRVVLGVVAAPGAASQVARRVVAEGLADQLHRRLPGALWEVIVEEDRLTAPPADDHDLIEAARRVMLDREWDLAVVLTDLPLHTRRRPVIAHASSTHGVAVVSVPAIGALKRGHRARDTILALLERVLLGDQNHDDRDPAETAQRQQQLAARVRELGTDVPLDQPYAFTAQVLTGNLRLLVGMVRANKPWQLTLRLSRALTAAAAAGVFALVTADIWRLADSFGAIRLTGATIVSIVAITATLIVGAQLWERPLHRRSREQVALFNIATTATVLIGVAAFYVFLLALAALGAYCLVVPHSFSDAVGHSVSAADYAELAWLTCSLATVGGALGAGLESDDAVREAAYARH
ncbi:MAG: hypothetical protein KAH46_24940 [Mycobacterium sp.]|nr:hypothetical protein [Mycobacterium sp.]